MRKKILITFVAMCLGTAGAQAATIDVQAAHERAAKFLHEREEKGLRKVHAARPTELEHALSGTAFHVFNVAERKGFVIVGGSDEAPEILGYADEGHMAADSIPPQLSKWLQSLSGSIRRAPTPTKRYIAPMVTSRWNQGSPYNLYMPYYKKDDGTISSGNDRSATGCVATAMAQIMYYWKWPREATKEIPGYTSYWNMTRTFDALEPTVFDWDAMQDTYDDNASQAAKEAVSKLMLYVGHSIYMGYGPASGAGASNTAIALRSFYDYSPDLFWTSHDSYTYTEWENLIYTELSEGRPVLMNGDTSDLTGGHEWVCDGYDGNGCFHMNWGWGGMCDGFFVLTVMQPDNQGIGGSSSSDGYSMSQAIVVGLQPNDGSAPATDDEVRLAITKMEVDQRQYTRKNADAYFMFPVSYMLKSNMHETHVYDAVFTLFDAEGNVVKEVLSTLLNNTQMNAGSVWGTRPTMMLGNGISEGTFYIKARSREHGTADWFTCEGGDARYLRLDITDDTLLTITQVPAAPDLHINTLELVGGSTVGVEQKVRVNVTNLGGEYYANTFMLVDGVWKSGNCIAIEPGQTTDVYFKYKPESYGEHTFALSTSKTNANEVFYETVIDVTEAAVADIAVSGKILNTVEKSVIYSNQVRVEAKLTNRGDVPYVGALKSSAWKGASGWWTLVQSKSAAVSLAAHSDTTVIFTYEGLDYGYSHDFHIDTDIEGRSYNCSGNRLAEGLAFWKADGTMDGVAPTTSGFTIGGDIVAAKIPGTTSFPTFYVADDYNPNLTLYYDADATIPSRVLNILKRKVKNFVFGQQAETMTISDDGDAYFPLTILAKEVVYERHEATGWSTLTLPFAPESKEGIEAYEFSAVDGQTLYFNRAETIEANQPYLIHTDGEKLSLRATDALIASPDRVSTYSSDYQLIGITHSMSPDEGNATYTLASDGRTFEAIDDNATLLHPFRAYVAANSAEAALWPVLEIAGDAGTTGIGDLPLINDQTSQPSTTLLNDVYDLSGRKVANANTLKSLPKGIYIVKGNKVLK